MAQAPDLPEIDPSVGDAMFADLDTRTTDQVVADIAAANPSRHGMPVEERKRRARALTGVLDISNLVIEDQLIVAAGGDPNEMMPGNKPRWTVADEADAGGSRTVKDHLTGDEFGQTAGLAASAEQQPGSEGSSSESAASGPVPEVNDGSNPSGSAPHSMTVPGVGEVMTVAGAYAAERADAEAARFAEQRAQTHQAIVDHRMQQTCDHKFGEPLDDDSKCTRCGLTFGDWANS